MSLMTQMSLCNCGKLMVQWDGISGCLGAVVLVGRRHVYGHFYHYAISWEFYRGLDLPESSQKVLEMPKSSLLSPSPVVGLCSIPLIALSNIRLNPLLTCSSWKVKNHFSDSLGMRI